MIGKGITMAKSAAHTQDVLDGRLYTVAEVAEMMRLSKMSVYRMIHAGDLEAVRFGRSFRVPAEAMNSYVNDSQYKSV